MRTITKRDIVRVVSDNTEIKQSDVSTLLEEILEMLTSELAQGNRVEIRGFGVMEVIATKARVGRNPLEPEKDIPVPPRATVKFRAGKEMRERVARILPELQKGKQKLRSAKRTS